MAGLTRRKRLAADQALIASSDFAALSWSDEGGGWTSLSGDITLVQAETGHRTVLPVNVRFPPRYPKAEPIASSPSTRFKRRGHRHINSDGTFCLWTPEETQWRPGEPDALLRYLYHLVYFLENQLIFEVTGKWRGPERRAGDDGRADYLRETFGCDEQTALFALKSQRGELRVQRHSACPCESNKTWDKCHRRLIAPLVTHINERQHTRS